MSEFPVSPGPWKFGYTDDLQTLVIVDENDDVVCVMHEGVATKYGKLMATAPELLDALIELDDCGGEIPSWSTRDKVRAAIAKATGSAA